MTPIMTVDTTSEMDATAMSIADTRSIIMVILSGMGSYTKANAELCLLAMRGHIKSVDKTIPQVLMHPRLGHSVKPDEIMRRIELLFGSNTKKIELFARRKTDDWDCWGNEV